MKYKADYLLTYYRIDFLSRKGEKKKKKRKTTTTFHRDVVMTFCDIYLLWDSQTILQPSWTIFLQLRALFSIFLFVEDPIDDWLISSMQGVKRVLVTWMSCHAS